MRHLILAALLSLFPLLAEAQTRCAPLPQFEEYLRTEYGEKPLIEWDVRLSEGGEVRVVRVYANTETGTLSALVILSNGTQQVGCLQGTGENMRIAPQFKPQEMPL